MKKRWDIGILKTWKISIAKHFYFSENVVRPIAIEASKFYYVRRWNGRNICIMFAISKNLLAPVAEVEFSLSHQDDEYTKVLS